MNEQIVIVTSLSRRPTSPAAAYVGGKVQVSSPWSSDLLSGGATESELTEQLAQVRNLMPDEKYFYLNFNFENLFFKAPSPGRIKIDVEVGKETLDEIASLHFVETRTNGLRTLEPPQ